MLSSLKFLTHRSPSLLTSLCLLTGSPVVSMSSKGCAEAMLSNTSPFQLGYCPPADQLTSLFSFRLLSLQSDNYCVKLIFQMLSSYNLACQFKTYTERHREMHRGDTHGGAHTHSHTAGLQSSS